MSQDISDPAAKEIHVSLQSPAPLPPVSRSDRKILLQQRFQMLAEDHKPEGLSIDLNAVSVSAQTAEAAIPADRFDHLVESLQAKGVRVDRLREVQVIPPF